jgi:hypothetical protein
MPARCREKTKIIDFRNRKYTHNIKEYFPHSIYI